MVSAWATANHISLGQVVVDQKSNEITAIPKLLELLDVSGCLVTIDAMGCQAEIAGKIVEGEGRLRAGGQRRTSPTLHEGIVEFFLDHMEDDFARVKVSRHETKEHGHGRDEHRTYYVCDVPDDLPDRGRWKGLKRIGVAISDTVRGGKACDDVRYYILSKRLSARSFGAAVRGHWGIENSLHWQLDMSFGEDRSRIRKGHADANFAVVRRMALSLLKNEKSQKVGSEDETTHRRLERRLSRTSAVRNMTYGAIALGVPPRRCRRRFRVRPAVRACTAAVTGRRNGHTRTPLVASASHTAQLKPSSPPRAGAAVPMQAVITTSPHARSTEFSRR